MIMKAITQEKYGGPEALTLREVPDPVPGPGELLVRVRASSVNAADWHTMRGDPWVVRPITPILGLTAPKAAIRGHDIAGEVVAVGGTAGSAASARGGAPSTRDGAPSARGDGPAPLFSPGDEVFGDLGFKDGAFAEYAVIAADQAAAKPPSLTFEQAAAIPLAGSTALVAVRDAGKVSPGQRVLVNGASGGVGTFAVQIARALGADVTAVCSARNAGLLASLGASRVIDYAREDFTRSGPYDVILDLVGNRKLADLRRALEPAGTLLLSGGGVPRPGTGGTGAFGVMGVMMHGMLAARFARQRIAVPQPQPRAEYLQALAGLVEAGQVTPAIDRTYSLSEVPEAIRYVETEHARAKVVITVP
jgi:NADPH:quinone reductase-like Zn-dependent oxidoreductase